MSQLHQTPTGVLSGGAAAADVGDTIDYSCRFNDDDSAYLSRAFSGADSLKTFCIHIIFKRGNLGLTDTVLTDTGTTGTKNRLSLRINSLEVFSFQWGGIKVLEASMKFRDVAGYYHLTLRVDSTQATAANRASLEVNGVEPSYSTDARASITQNSETAWGESGATGYIGSYNGSSNFWDGYIARHYYIDGDDSVVFGRYSTTHPTVWVYAAPSPTYGTDGHKLDFAVPPGTGNGAGTDVSGNANHFTDTNLASTDQSANTPTNVFPTLSQINKDASIVLEKGSNRAIGVSGWDTVFSTMKTPNSGKWYFESCVITNTASNGFCIGIHRANDKDAQCWPTYIGNTTATYGLGYAMYGTGQWRTDNTQSGVILSTFVANDVVSMAVDLDNNKIWFGENGVWDGDPSAGTGEAASITNAEYLVGCSPSVDEDYHLNFGDDSTFGGAIAAGGNADGNGIGDFKHTVPTGFLALCHANLPTAEEAGGVLNPEEGFQIVTDTGANIVATLAAALATGDWLKVYKDLDATDDWKWIFHDDASNMWDSSLANSKAALAAPSGAATWMGMGIRISADYGVATSEVSHTNGVATDFAHGLGVAPAYVIVFPDLAHEIMVYHQDLDSGKLIQLSTQKIQTTDAHFTVDATNVTIAAAEATGGYRILAFAEKPGFSSFQYHESNGSTDGPVANCGFSSEAVFTVDIDLTDSSLNYELMSQKLHDQVAGNVQTRYVKFDKQDAEATVSGTNFCDFLANGVKTRSSSSEYNTTRDHVRCYFARAPVFSDAPFPNAR